MGEISRKHVPMFRYALLLSVGIGLAHYITIPLWVAVLAATGALCYTLYRLVYTRKNYQQHLFISISVAVLAVGVVRQQLWEAHETPILKKCRITSFPRKQAFQIQFEATILNTPQLHLFDTETFLVTCSDTSLQLAYGDVFTCNKTPEIIAPPALPIEFDYRTYLYGNGITHRLNLCTLVPEKDSSRIAFFYAWIEASRRQFKKATALVFSSAESKGLAESLLLGYKEGLDTETKDAFLKSGVSHLLAVSGMHTALLYEALFLLFLPFGSSQKHRFVFLISALFLLTYFTLLSGCSASVLRSSVMCSMFAIAYTFRKRSSGLNTLGTSILLILWFSPYQLWNLGFQLSVLAVAGIVTLHQYITRHITFENRVYRYLFEGTSITVCAQITTLPVVLYHFQSFPIYFIPANLILIPVSTLALFASMFSIFLVGLGIHADWIFSCTQKLMELFAWCADYIAALPNSSVQPISLSAAEAWGILLLVAYYMERPFVLNRKTIYLCTLLCIVWSGYRISEEYKTESKVEQVFVCNGKKSALLSIHGLDATIYTQTILKPFDKAKINAHFNIRNLHEILLPKNNSGLIAPIGDTHIGWIYKKNCTPISVHLSYLYTYKNADSLMYAPKHYQSLKVKCLTSF